MFAKVSKDIIYVAAAKSLSFATLFVIDSQDNVTPCFTQFGRSLIEVIRHLQSKFQVKDLEDLLNHVNHVGYHALVLRDEISNLVNLFSIFGDKEPIFTHEEDWDEFKLSGSDELTPADCAITNYMNDPRYFVSNSRDLRFIAVSKDTKQQIEVSLSVCDKIRSSIIMSSPILPQRIFLLFHLVLILLRKNLVLGTLLKKRAFRMISSIYLLTLLIISRF